MKVMENEDAVGQMYDDGRLAKEIEHLLVTRLHTLNTVGEVETLKDKIFTLMLEMYKQGFFRDEEG